MEPKYSKIFNKKTLESIVKYCELNKIDNIDGFIKKCFDSGFNIEKYGLLGKTSGIEEKQVEIEVIREKRVEIPVEVIKEVEKIIEVPVEVIKEVEKIVEIIKEVEKIVEVPKEVIKEIEKIVEVPVEVVKQVYITDEKQVNELALKVEDYETKIFQLNKEFEEERQNFSTKTTEMENNFQLEMSKKDNELDEVRRSLDIKLDDTQNKMLQETLQKLRKELSEKNQKIKELEDINQEHQLKEKPKRGFFMRGSNLNDTL